jgi:outer membrane cobalamin receptor
MGARIAYNYQNTVDVEIKGAINNWTVNSESYAWNKPKYEAELNTGVKINPNLTISANAYYEGGRFAKIGSTAVPMGDKVDINLGVSYNYNSWLTAFAKINNLINSQYQNFYGYDVQGLNMMIGAAFSF